VGCAGRLFDQKNNCRIAHENQPAPPRRTVCHERQAVLRKSLDDYLAAISSVSNVALLDKALRLGEISVIEYFLETIFYQNATLHFLKTEHEYQVAVAELMKYRL
jgi:outer membrane protein, heavy metal efflux system